MHRRAVLATIVSGASLSGCLSLRNGSPAESTEPPSTKSPSTESPSKETTTQTPVRHTADGIEATFQIVDGHRPTDDTANATFSDSQVVVTGTIDPAGCNRPTLTELRYTATDGIIHLTIGGESPYGPTATIECGNASFDYRCVLSTERGRPTTVELIHNYQDTDNRSFTLERA